MRKAALFLICGGLAAILVGISLPGAGFIAQSRAERSWSEAAKRPSREDAPRQQEPVVLTRISFPKQGSSYFIRDGATVENLLLGPVRVTTSVLPGQKGNSIVAAHRDTQFSVLKDVRRGDEIILEDNKWLHRYRVVDLQVVTPEDDRFYRPTENAVLTLVTCYPFFYLGPAPKRFIVRAELVAGT